MRKRGLGGNYVTPYNLNCSLIRFDTPPACGGEVHLIEQIFIVKEVPYADK